MQILVKGKTGQTPSETFLIEMQGDLESRKNEHLEGKFIGDLHYSKDGTPIMIIGHHILYGKVIDLEKPLVAIEKVEVEKDLDREEMMDMDEHLEMKREFRVNSIIKKKLVFKTRPKPIIRGRELARMPRKKQGPQRLDAEAQEAARFVMGETEASDENNAEINQALTQTIREAPSEAVEDIIRNVGGEGDRQPEPQQFSIIIDDDSEDSYHSSDDEDFVPALPKKRGGAGKAKKKKKPAATVVEVEEEEEEEIDEELEGLLEDAELIIPVLERASDNAIWHSSIGKLEVEIDLVRHQQSSVQLPEWNQGFQLYISAIPGRSIIYFEKFQQRLNESEYSFKVRQKKGKPDDKTYFFLKDMEDTSLLNGFAMKQNIIFLKYNKLFELSGVLELKICIHENSILALSHPSELSTRVPDNVRATLNHCFNITTNIPADDENSVEPADDIDSLYNQVKKFHDEATLERERRVHVDPQHRSLIPKLRPYQAQAVRWMLEQEKYREHLDQDLEEAEEEGELHPLYREVVAEDGSVLYYSPLSGYLLRQRPVRQPRRPGGILADEMGLGKTVEILSLMLCNPRRNVAQTEYREPIIVQQRKKKRRRRRTPSPVEFVIKDSDEDVGNGDVIYQLDGGDTDSEDSDGGGEDGTDEDEDFQPGCSVKVKPRTSRRNGSQAALKRVFSDDRTVYYHEDFDSLSSEGEDIPPPSKRTKQSKKSSEKANSTNSTSQKGPKVINTLARHDKSRPIFSPFKNDKFNEKSASIYDQIVKAIQVLAEGKKATEGITVRNIKVYLEKHFKRNITNKKFLKNFTESVDEGLSVGQFVKTSIGKGAALSITLNLHYNPDDTRAKFVNRDLSPEETVMEAVITEHCYGGEDYQPVHIPQIFKKNIETLEKKKSEKGELYKKMKSMYEMSLPISLAFYASDKRSKDWNREYFNTKVDQKAYFECLCGGTEEARDGAGYRVQCQECGTEQHAECVKYDIKDPYRGEYFCPHCWVQKDKVESGATLIVSPSSISFQWIEEMQKHIKHKDIKMLFYKGSKDNGYIQPRTLGSYDIVITTYEVLASETSYVDLPHSNSTEGRRFRNPKRYMAMPSPITSIQWWRICLDEAQMIESTRAKTAEMALRLSGVNKWCVTGTPVGKSLNDLYGLLLFLQVDPYLVETWWRLGVLQPYTAGDSGPMLSVLKDVLWRTCKKDVLHQIDIPDQTEELHWLQFSPVEEHFYRRQHIDISRDVITKLRKHEPATKLTALDRQSLSTLLLPLLKLRQACCHPQAVRGQFMSLQKTTMTMEQLLEQLISKAKNEAEEAHRLYIAALNGLAGLDIIQENWAEAAEKYREVLRSAGEQEGRIKTDTLQKLHTITNLAEILEAKHPGVAPTLRDDELRAEAGKLRDYYMGKYFGGVSGARDAVTPVSKVVESCYNGFTNKTAWYEEVISWVEAADHEKQLMKLVHEEMSAFFDVVDEKEFKEVVAKYPNSRLVLYKIFDKLSELDKNREAVTKKMKFLSETDPQEFLNKAIDCHLRVSTVAQKYKKKCPLCEVHDLIEVYENTLFHFVKGEIKGNKINRASVTEDERKELEKAGVFLHDEQKRGSWSDSEPERLLRAVLKFTRGKQALFSGSVLEDGNTQMKLLENLKKEFRLTRIYWRQIYDSVAGVDELNMCTMRLRLRLAGEDMSDTRERRDGPDLATRQKEKVETIYILERHEVEPQKLKLVADKFSSQAELKKKLGQLLYLENLKNTDYGRKGGHNPETCPICVKELGSQWSVLQCGHCYCVDCIRVLIDEYSRAKSTKCAVCRSVTAHAEISYVSTKIEEEEQLDMEAVKGSHSTKVEAVIKCLLRVRSEDEEAKSLVFSTWPDVLDILATALEENDIAYAALHKNASTTQNKFKRNIQKFKNRDDVKVLLMPISQGANGLNLIEASHVILVEPLLNPAQELQAIGRVHRIGQKKRTFVHRFLVRQTIEERIQSMLSNYHRDHESEEQGSHSTEENLLTIQDLRNIFVDEDSLEFEKLRQDSH